MPAFTWLPANEATPEDVEAVFGAGGAALMTISRKTPLSIPGRISELKTLRKSFRLTRWREGF